MTLFFCDEHGRPMLDLPFFWSGMERLRRWTWAETAAFERIFRG
jgi:hypothetical protein